MTDGIEEVLAIIRFILQRRCKKRMMRKEQRN